MESIGKKLLTWLKVNFTSQKIIRNSTAALEWLLSCSYSYKSKETFKSLPDSSEKDPFFLLQPHLTDFWESWWWVLALPSTSPPFRLGALNTSLTLHLLLQISSFPSSSEISVVLSEYNLTLRTTPTLIVSYSKLFDHVLSSSWAHPKGQSSYSSEKRKSGLQYPFEKSPSSLQDIWLWNGFLCHLEIFSN